MAEAYRGLTIRIGADTTNLRSAMSGLKHASHSLQTDFRKLSRALKIDPSSTRLAQATLRTTRNYMQSAAAEAGRLNRALKEIGAQKGYGRTTQTIQQLSNHTKNAQLEAVRAKEAYNGLDKQLEQVYRAVAKYRSVKLHAGSFKQEYDYVRKLAHSWKDATAQENLYLNMRMAVRNGQNPWNLSGEGEELVAQYEKVFTRIRNEWKKTEERLGRAKQVVGFQNIRNDAELAMAKIRELSVEYTKLRSAQLRLGTGNVKKLAGEIERLGNDAKNAEARMNKLDEALRLDPYNIEAAKQKMIALNESTDATRHALEKAEQRLKEMNKQGFQKAIADAEKLGKSAEEIKHGFTEANAKVEKLSGELDEARAHAQKLANDGEKGTKAYKEAWDNVRTLEKRLERAEKEAKKLNEQFEIAEKSDAYKEQAADIELMRSKLSAATREQKESLRLARISAGRSLRTAGYAMMSTITPTLMMGGMYMVQAADDVDAAYRNMRKTVQGTEEDFENLRAEAMEFASTHVTSTDQMLEIEAIGGQLGIAVENLDEFGETVANLDIATNMNTEDIAADLGKMGSVLGMTADDYDNFGDALVRLGNNMPAFESDIMTITTRFMGMGKIVGMTAPEMLAWATAATATGQKAEAAGSSMQRFISGMENAVVSGGEKLEVYARVAGMSADEFARLFNESASDAMYAFVYGLGEVQKSGESVNQVLGELGINNVRDKQLIEGLAQQMANATGQTNLLNDALTMSKDAWNGVADEWGQAGDAAREADKKAEGFSGQLQILKNNAQILFVEFSEGLAPILSRINEIVQQVTAVFSSMSDSTKSAIITILGLAAALGPAFVMVGSGFAAWQNLNQQITVMGGAWEKTVKKTKNAKGQLQTITTYYDRLGNEITQTETQVKGANGALETVTKTSKKAAPVLTKLGNAAKLAGASFGPMLIAMAAITAIGYAINKYNDYKKHLEDVKHATDDLADATSNMNDMFSEAVGRASVTAQGYDVVAMSVDELTEYLGSSTDKINELVSDASFSAGELEQAWRVIAKATYHPEWAEEHIGQVEYAASVFTEYTGYQLDTEQLITGEYLTQLGLLQDMVEVSKERLDQEMAREIYVETGKDEYYAKQTLEAAYAEEERVAALYERNPNMNRREYREAVKAREEAEKEYAAAAKAHGDSLDYMEKANENYVSSADDISAWLQKSENDIWENMPDADKIEQLGTSYDDFSEALARFGVSTYDLASLDSSQIAALFEAYASGGDFELGEKINELGLEFNYATDEAEQLAFICADLGDGPITYRVTDDGSIELEGTKLEGFQAIEVDGKQYILGDDGSVYDEMGKLDEIDAQIVRDKWFSVNADTSSAWGKINELARSNVTAGVNIVAKTTSLVDSINAILAVRTFQANLKAKLNIGGAATGGFIPAHAAGGFNGIATGPILTNQGLVGEAGAEAIMRWAGGTAIVPLENRQYVRPFARTVAEEMPMAFGAYGGVTAGEIAAALANMDLQVRMDSGELVGVLVNNSRRRAAMNV